ncbi:hypothetical protein Pint_20009 [Pistacia integerrima]|uniref:Uncharacterized protein n=1 Tax=Pistacia integerrima TaxID=434235 RepID=A0ACC0XA12_9ROSI|nr:hypothetical protein Pint_20009 [Pistacia integerrima]
MLSQNVNYKDPFLRISRIVENGDPVPICKTEDNPLIIECFDFNSSGNHILLGKIQKSIGDLEKLRQGKTGADFIKPSAHRGREKVLKGQLFVDKFIEKEQFSFLDYISSGFELNFMVAVDFTTWGFGGRTFDGTISHCFNLNGSSNGFEVEGVEGIMAAYANASHNVSLAGPTLFGQVINITWLHKLLDGVLTDLQETKDALGKDVRINCSYEVAIDGIDIRVKLLKLHQ